LPSFLDAYRKVPVNGITAPLLSDIDPMNVSPEFGTVASVKVIVPDVDVPAVRIPPLQAVLTAVLVEPP